MPDQPTSAINELLDRAARADGGTTLGRGASLALAVLTCMDSRVDVHRVFGLEDGEAHIIRNAGGIATEDALRSLEVSQRLLGTREILVLHHSDCAMEGAPAELGGFPELAASLRATVERLRGTVALPHRDRIRGFVLDLPTGRLRDEV